MKNDTESLMKKSKQLLEKIVGLANPDQLLFVKVFKSSEATLNAWYDYHAIYLKALDSVPEGKPYLIKLRELALDQQDAWVGASRLFSETFTNEERAIISQALAQQSKGLSDPMEYFANISIYSCASMTVFREMSGEIDDVHEKDWFTYYHKVCLHFHDNMFNYLLKKVSPQDFLFSRDLVEQARREILAGEAISYDEKSLDNLLLKQAPASV